MAWFRSGRRANAAGADPAGQSSSLRRPRSSSVAREKEKAATLDTQLSAHEQTAFRSRLLDRLPFSSAASNVTQGRPQSPDDYTVSSHQTSRIVDDDNSDTFFDAEEQFDHSTESLLKQSDHAEHRPHFDPVTGAADSLTGGKWDPSILPSSQSDAPTLYANKCEVCETSSRDIQYCNVCKTSFCGDCWEKQWAHQKKKLGPGAIPHEKTSPEVAEKVRNVLTPPEDDRLREQMYRDDEITSWFGIERPSDLGSPLFQDFGRFADLMAATDPVRNGSHSSFLVDGAQFSRDTRTPSLVSFVGQTGAGKSTLIKLIVDLASDGHETYATPVIGSSGAHVPTSEDVHLYLDPRTATGASPVLFADCEGLEGGEREPLGALFKKKRRNENRSESHMAGRISRAIKIISERELTWADGPRTRSREFAVTNLYPRLLYTFSDVIVFVLKNPRVIEHVFEKLVEWAAAAIETSSNQPVLPHAIIVLNASENDIDPSLWDVNSNTASILDDLASTIHRNEKFQKYSQFWRSRGKTIDTLEQLVLSYYSSVQILRVPADGRPRLMQDQVEKLYNGLLSACIAARSNKASLRMLLDVEDLQSYLDYAFSHFSGTLEFPFDFVQASFINSPIPPDFGGNILKLAIHIADVWKDSIDASSIFTNISLMVASCIMFESARNNIPGNVEQIFPKYLEHIDAALENFCDKHWPCEFVKEGSSDRCINVRSGHGSKGHQLKDGRVFATGDYVSRFSFSSYHQTFRENVFFNLWNLLNDLQQRVLSGDQPRQAAADIHRDKVLHSFYELVADGADISELFNSHTACFCCLFEPPEHVLPCGHVLCTSCVKMYGHSQNPNEFEMYDCPLEKYNTRPYQSWKIQIKPSFAGIRILALDGGGMRGIVELEILRAIEKSLDVHIPIQYFFDLIVGTSTGGVIALGLGSMNWSVEECLAAFERMCRKAFTPRLGSSVPLVSFLVENYNHSKYETKPLEQTLQEAFTEDLYLFGGSRKSGGLSSPIKVAVTGTTIAGRTPIVFGNYNRFCSDKLQYHFQRPDKRTFEMKIWEVARATSAAPRYFRPYFHEPTQKSYVDGAVYHNNPVQVAEQERKLIWPNLEDQYPDIVLSLGTASSAKLRRSESERMNQRGFVSHGKVLLSLLKNHMATSIECERIWDAYLVHLPKSVQFSRFVRLNPELPGDVPALDEVKNMSSLQMTVRRMLQQDDRIHKVALQLLATSFYFQLYGPIVDNAPYGYSLEGRILCRLSQKSREIIELGKFLRQRLGESKKPVFVVKEQDQIAKSEEAIQISTETVDRMIRLGIFTMPRVLLNVSTKSVVTEILLYLDARECFPISGFPRSLFRDEKQTTAPQRPISSNRNRWAGSSLRSKTTRHVWKAPDPEVLRKRGATGNLSSPLSGSTLALRQGAPAKKADEAAAPGEDATYRGPAAYFRSAFRALARPVRSRPLKTPIDSAEGQKDDDDNAYEVDSGENAVYQRWIDGLQKPNATSPGVEAPPPKFQGISELPGDYVFPVEAPVNRD